MHGERIADDGVDNADEEGEQQCMRQMLRKEQRRRTGSDEE